jgi:hypothetical protein
MEREVNSRRLQRVLSELPYWVKIRPRSWSPYRVLSLFCCFQDIDQAINLLGEAYTLASQTEKQKRTHSKVAKVSNPV